MLDELTEDLKTLVEQTESNWWSWRALGQGRPCQVPEGEAGDRGSVRTIRTADGQSAEVKIAYDPQEDEVRVIVNGHPLAVPRVQQLLIRRHEERINAILRESMKPSEHSAPR
jgi:hypothetical protein